MVARAGRDSRLDVAPGLVLLMVGCKENNHTVFSRELKLRVGVGDVKCVCGMVGGEGLGLCVVARAGRNSTRLVVFMVGCKEIGDDSDTFGDMRVKVGG